MMISAQDSAPRASVSRSAALLLILATSGGGLLLQVFVSIGLFQGRGQSAVAALWFVLLFFTILTNTLVVVAAVSALRDPSGGAFWSKPSTQSAVALYITAVGITYSLLLRGLVPLDGLAKTADFLLHDATPVLFVIYWLLFVPKGTLSARHLPQWLIYPAIYLVYALARGAAGGFYPYPFLDVAAKGFGVVAMNALMMLGLFAVLGYLIVAIDTLIGRRRADSA